MPQCAEGERVPGYGENPLTKHRGTEGPAMPGLLRASRVVRRMRARATRPARRVGERARPLRVVPRALPGGREGCEDGPGTTTSGEDALRVWRSLPFVNSPEVRARCPDPAFVRSNA